MKLRLIVTTGGLPRGTDDAANCGAERIVHHVHYVELDA